ncbi:hypothetical protein SSX86_032079 [Deinandra increscens subsp. villosa]|uniref:Uncharacterized protein n=1 Tax=Deinandra increscens subsp. villosa TaxID=3103831 RepID=A0AAP0C8S9_9ASTR
MAQPECSSVVIFGSQFTAPHEFNLIVDRNPSSGDLVITDTENKVMFTITSLEERFHKLRLLKDESGRRIATLRDKNMTTHARWKVFRGKSVKDSALIFSTVTDNMIQNRTHVNVFLANNKSDDCDFKIKGNWSNKDCYIYDHSTSAIAHMLPMESTEKFMVKINPNVDYAFVVALIVILDAIESVGPIEVVVAKHVAQIALGVVTTVAQCTLM